MTCELVTVIPCGRAKLAHPAPAVELYRGAQFLLARHAADQLGEAWRYYSGRHPVQLILSARHGLVHYDSELAPYDQTLTRASEARQLGELVRRQADSWGLLSCPVVALVPQLYAVAALYGWPHALLPLDRQPGIGHQRHVLAAIAGSRVAAHTYVLGAVEAQERAQLARGSTCAR